MLSVTFINIKTYPLGTAHQSHNLFAAAHTVNVLQMCWDTEWLNLSARSGLTEAPWKDASNLKQSYNYYHFLYCTMICSCYKQKQNSC